MRHLLEEVAARGCRNLVLEVDHEPSDGTGDNGAASRPPEQVDAWIRHWVHFIAEHSAPPGIPVLVHHDSWHPVEQNHGGSRYPYATDPQLAGLPQYIKGDSDDHHVRGLLPEPRPIVARQLADNWAGVGAGMAGEATCLAAPGVAGVVFLPDGGSVSIDLREWAGRVRAEWYDPRAGGFTGTAVLEGGRVIEIASPTREDWVLSLGTADGTISAR